MHEPDYIDRTIQTVRLHAAEKDNCWPQWANIFADEIESLRERLVDIEATLVVVWAERAYVYECSRRRLKPRWDDLDDDIRAEWLEEARLDVQAALEAAG